MHLDGTLQVNGFEPHPVEPDRSQQADIPTHALQICGLRVGALSEPAECHKWKIPNTVADLLEPLHARWLAFKEKEMEEPLGSPQQTPAKGA